MLAGHSSLCQLTIQQKANVANLSRASAPPRTIANVLRHETDEQHPVTVKDIYNIRQQILTKAFTVRTPIAALAEQLSIKQFCWKVKTIHQGHITHLFFAAHKSLMLYKWYPEVLLLNCTYKTNQFKTVFFIMVSITGMNTIFNVRFAFICTEQKSRYA